MSEIYSDRSLREENTAIVYRTRIEEACLPLKTEISEETIDDDLE